MLQWVSRLLGIFHTRRDVARSDIADNHIPKSLRDYARRRKQEITELSRRRFAAASGDGVVLDDDEELKRAHSLMIRAQESLGNNDPQGAIVDIEEAGRIQKKLRSKE